MRLPGGAAHVAVLEAAMPRPDRALIAEAEALAGGAWTAVVLPCGHDPLPFEHLRAGSEHWCPTCARWWAEGEEA